MQTREDRWAFCFTLDMLFAFFDFVFHFQTSTSALLLTTMDTLICESQLLVSQGKIQNPHPNRNVQLGTDLIVFFLLKWMSKPRTLKDSSSLEMMWSMLHHSHQGRLLREEQGWNEEGWGALNSSDLSLTHRFLLFITTQTWGNC